MSISNELKHALKGGAKPNKFKIKINAPITLYATNLLNKLGGGQTKNPDKKTIELLAKSASIPAREIDVVEVWHRGRKYPIRGMTQFDQRWEVTFYNDKDLSVRGFFEEWMYQIDRYDSVLADSAFIANYLGVGSINAGYMTDLTITQLCPDGVKEIAEYEIVHAYPTKISAQEFNSDANNVISTFTVTFAYDYFLRNYKNGKFGGGVIGSALKTLSKSLF